MIKTGVKEINWEDTKICSAILLAFFLLELYNMGKIRYKKIPRSDKQ